MRLVKVFSSRGTILKPVQLAKLAQAKALFHRLEVVLKRNQHRIASAQHIRFQIMTYQN